MKNTLLVLLLANSSLLFGDISEYITSVDEDSISFKNTQAYAELTNMSVSEKSRINGLVVSMNQLGLSKVFLQTMTENNFGTDDLLLQVQMYEILKNFNSEYAKFFDIVGVEQIQNIDCSLLLTNNEIQLERLAKRKGELWRLHRVFDRKYKVALKDLQLLKKQLDMLSNNFFFNYLLKGGKEGFIDPPFDNIGYWRKIDNAERVWAEKAYEIAAISNFVKPDLYLDISILEKPLSSFFLQNNKLELIKVSLPASQPKTFKKDGDSFLDVLPYFYKDFELENMSNQNTELLEDTLGVYSDYFDIKNQIPLFNLDRGKEPHQTVKKNSTSDCEKIFNKKIKEDLVEIRRDIELLEIRKQIFDEISDQIEDFIEHELDLYRNYPLLIYRMVDTLEPMILDDKNYLYGHNDYQLLSSSIDELKSQLSDASIPFYESFLAVLNFYKKLAASKNQVQISNNNNILVNDVIINADILHIGDLSYFKSAEDDLYGYFNKGKWNLLDQYETYIEDAFVAFESNEVPYTDPIIIPAPVEYVAHAKRYFDKHRGVESDIRPNNIGANQIHEKFTTLVIQDQEIHYCRNIGNLASEAYNRNSVYGQAQRSNQAAMGLYRSAEGNIDAMSKIADLTAAGYDFSNYLENFYGDERLKTIDRLAKLAWSNSYMDRHGVMSRFNFSDAIRSACF